MNEYQDQAVWFRAEVISKSGRWLRLSDYDTREDADREWGDVPNVRVRRMSGLA